MLFYSLYVLLKSVSLHFLSCRHTSVVALLIKDNWISAPIFRSCSQQKLSQLHIKALCEENPPRQLDFPYKGPVMRRAVRDIHVIMVLNSFWQVLILGQSDH